MILHHVNMINEGVKSIKIDNGKIVSIYQENKNTYDTEQVHLYFENCLAFPGLINSHDHLDFNLFPQLGGSIYKNYMDWGSSLHKLNKAVIGSILNIPKELRTQWGMYKNLINGITTVVQHGDGLVTNNAPINVFTQSHTLHSVGLEKRWKLKLNNLFSKNYPFAIHIGEGTDKYSFKEIDRLLKWNVFKRKLIGIHGVAMNPKQASHFEALVWCPDSNFFTLGQTAAIAQLKTKTKILFGTDSTLSADWNIWEQLRKARQTNLLTDDELINAVSSLAAATWKLNNTGILKEGYHADMIVTEKKKPGDTDAFFATSPEDIMLILDKGKIIYFDESLLLQLTHIQINNYSKIFIKGRCKYVIGELPALIKQIKKYAPNCTFPVEIE